MEVGTEITYKGFRIYHNMWGEFCVCHSRYGGMVAYNAGFYYLKHAKQFIDLIAGLRYYKEDFEREASAFKKRVDNECFRPVYA